MSSLGFVVGSFGFPLKPRNAALDTRSANDDRHVVMPNDPAFLRVIEGEHSSHGVTPEYDMWHISMQAASGFAARQTRQNQPGGIARAAAVCAALLRCNRCGGARSTAHLATFCSPESCEMPVSGPESAYGHPCAMTTIHDYVATKMSLPRDLPV